MTKPPAMPELPEPFALSVSVHEGDTPAKTYVKCMLYQKHPNEKQRLYTADQIRAYALAALQSAQPAAAVSDDDILTAGHRTAWRYKHSSDPAHSSTYTFNCACLLQFARAILTLRPQATPNLFARNGAVKALADLAVQFKSGICMEESLESQIRGILETSDAMIEVSAPQQATPEPVGEAIIGRWLYEKWWAEYGKLADVDKPYYTFDELPEKQRAAYESLALMLTRPAPDGWTEADADAARLAMELECLLLDTKDTVAVSRWWKSANEALDLHRARLAAAQAKGVV